MASRKDKNYFEIPNPIMMIIVGVLLYLLVMATSSPDKIPAFFGPLGSFSAHVGKTYPNFCVSMCVFATVVHAMEAAYAGKVCHDREYTTSARVKWVLFTFMFGFPSLGKLLRAGKQTKSS